MSRRPNDAYYTPDADLALAALFNRVRIGGAVMEPCAGDGALATPLRARLRGKGIFENDIARGGEDARTMRLENVAWVITNPPFSQAFAIAQNLLPQVDYGMALLLRLSFLEPTFDRAAWLAENPPKALIVLPRMSFTGNGKGDSVTCAWMIWSRYIERQLIAIASENKRPRKRQGVTP